MFLAANLSRGLYRVIALDSGCGAVPMNSHEVGNFPAPWECAAEGLVAAGRLWLGGLPGTYESIQNGLYSLVASEFAAAHLGDEFVGEPVHLVTTESQCSLRDSRSLARDTGCGIVHTWLISEHRHSRASHLRVHILLVGCATSALVFWAGVGAARGAI